MHGSGKVSELRLQSNHGKRRSLVDVSSNASKKLLTDRLLTILAYRWKMMESLAKRNLISAKEVESFYPALAMAYPNKPAPEYPLSIWRGHLFESPKDLLERISKESGGKESTGGQATAKKIAPPLPKSSPSSGKSPTINLDPN